MMGCNAWNHPSWCNCGWGGATRWGSSAAPVRSIRIPDGLDWSRGREATYESYVNPNARCPVCGANVYFYQSPYGGRVFFDALEPPWPKHPCTDNYFRSATPRAILPPDGPIAAKVRPLKPDPAQWQPLIIEDAGDGTEPFVTAPADLSTYRLWLYLPRRLVEQRPALWRKLGRELEVGRF